ncbi:hypothetical protein HRbin04_00342 [archaeon HR04]|nr:hypothetical protein HRbin04_00342 [archaeon HR04]
MPFISSITATISQIESRLDRDARYLLVDVKKGSVYILACLVRDMPISIGEHMQCILVTDIPTNTARMTLLASDWSFIRRSYSMEEVGGNMVSIADITFDRAGDWIVLAEFGDGKITSIKASVAFNVVPEGVLGTIAIITTTLATTALYLRRRISNHK